MWISGWMLPCKVWSSDEDFAFLKMIEKTTSFIFTEAHLASVLKPSTNMATSWMISFLTVVKAHWLIESYMFEMPLHLLLLHPLPLQKWLLMNSKKSLIFSAWDRRVVGIDFYQTCSCLNRNTGWVRESIHFWRDTVSYGCGISWKSFIISRRRPWIFVITWF